MSFCSVRLLVDTFGYQKTEYVGEFLVINDEMLLLKYIRVRTPRAHRTIRRFIKTACEFSKELKIDIQIHHSVTSLLNIHLVKTRVASSGVVHERKKENAKRRCL